MSEPQRSTDGGPVGGDAKEYFLAPEDSRQAIDVARLNNRDSADYTDVGPDQETGKYTALGFGDFHSYFDQRKHKLAEQAKERAARAPAQRQIFAGVVFHINGYTQPSHYELKKLLIERGGQFLHYISKSEVTHIIASNLSRSKEKEFRNYRVVRPEWVVECVQADRLLSWHSYRIIGSGNMGAPVAPLNIDELGPHVGLNAQINRENAVAQGAVPAKETVSRSLQQTTEASTSTHRRNAVVDRFGEGLNREWVRRNLATESDFIPRYYENSRLHHLSTWKAEMKDYVAQLRREYGKEARPVVGGRRVIIHADFDCFFVAVSLLSFPHMKNMPVAVCHTQQHAQLDSWTPQNDVPEHPNGQSSQIASCNYVARSFGVKNGMFLGQAKQLCPALATVPYCFDAYKRVSKAFYDIVTRIADETQAVSVDEALLDVSDVVYRQYKGDTNALAQDIRRRVLEKTECAVSIGIGSNILLARLATTKAKPDGVYELDSNTFYNMDLGVRDLPGVGHVLEKNLAQNGINTVADIRCTPLPRLKSICGDKTALQLYNFSRGIDNRMLTSDKLRQAFGADIGWGVRFSTQHEADDFILRMAEEVCKSMAAFNRTGALVTLKIKKRGEGQGKPGKFLGHGICDNISKSASLPQMTNDHVQISSTCIRLLHEMAIDPLDIRAVGIHVQQLNTLDSSATISDMFAKARAQVNNSTKAAETKSSADMLPSASQLDPSVISELPDSIQQELRAAYQQMNSSSSMAAFSPNSVSPDKIKKARSASSSVKSTRAPAGSRRGRPRKLAFAAPNTKTEKARPNLLQAFRKVETLDSIMPSQMDGDVWDHLPTNIRRELAREYIKSKPPLPPSALSNRHANQTENSTPTPVIQPPKAPEYSGPTLLGKHTLSDLKLLIESWATSSVDGPLKEDVAAFGDFVEELVKHRDLVKANSVLVYLRFCTKERQDVWADALSAALDRANRVCNSMYGALLQP
ncbi:deoxycytidyl transferase [Coemansia guatemalensis]|uniref:DNA repair protein REV1 n=1 Tax=Coemansia guatemalensis TaxID=2761395 RepID=A0A9W8HT03_9FUNG|nr:deoxycytidyl transferase [Coemansia guatemalensis]